MNFFNKKPERIFLDYASTTPIDKEVLSVMQKYDEHFFANPSALYGEALEAKEALRNARERIANSLNCQKDEVIFTSGGTEGNNLALLGVFEHFKKPGFIPHIITTNIEHPAILEVCNEILRRGGEVTKVSVNSEGLIDSKVIKESIKETTVLISVSYANNEIGTIAPIKEIARVVRDWKTSRGRDLDHFPFVHTDACQAPLYLDVDVLKLGVDLLTLDGIKMYGPRGAGILCKRKSLKISPIIFGGGQEKGLRSGTENVSGAMGLATALEKAVSLRESETTRLMTIRDYAIENILKNFPDANLNGTKENRLPNNLNICFVGLDAEYTVIALDVAGISVSYSSSCQTLKEDSSSYVISSLGKPDCASSSLRFTLGRESKMSDMDFLLAALKKIIK